MKTVIYGRGFWVITACLLLTLPVSVQAQMKGPPVPFSADRAEYDWAGYDDDDDYDDDYDYDYDYDEYDENGYADRGRYFASTEGIRVEGTVGDESYVVIVNVPRMVVWSLIGSERSYIEDAIDPDDFDDWDLGHFGSPCPTDARATRSGSETLDGRTTEKWTCVSPEWGTMTVWYDTRLQTVIRYENEDGYGELTNIREGRQPASLFVPPPGYRQIDVSDFDLLPESAFGGR
jgi:hypothetical protein